MAAVTALGLVVLAVLIRDPRYLLSRSFWLDEGWVVDSVRAPLRQLKLLTSSTPIGWTLLLRVVPPFGGPERYRLLPLAFSALTAVSAWRLGRKVGSYPWLHGLLAGTAAAGSSAVLAHTWLKQYSAEAFVAVTLSLLLARVERSWSRRSLASYVAVAAGCFLISNTTPVVAGSGLGALWLVTLLGRRWSRVPALAMASVVLGLAHGVMYQLLARSGNNHVLHKYWSGWYIPYPPSDHRPWAAMSTIADRFAALLGKLGWGPWWCALALILAGLVALWRAGLPAVTITQPAVLIVLVVAGILHAFPFMEPRTSIFFAAILTVTAAIGLASIASIAGFALRSHAGVLITVAGIVVAGWLVVPGWISSGRGNIPGESVRDQVAYVREHRKPGDVVLVAFGATFSFAYYWPDRPTFMPGVADTAVNFMPAYPDRTDLVLVHRPEDTRAFLDQAQRRGRVWVIAMLSSEISHLQGRMPNERFSTPAGTPLPALVTTTNP